MAEQNVEPKTDTNAAPAFRIMEVCGSHTMTAVKYGLRGILPENVRLVSGPGCPVCVTPASVIDGLVALSKSGAVVTFGDLFRVRGSRESLADAKASGGDVRVVYSPFDILNFAENEPGRRFIMAAVGFETTAPVYAALLERAAEKKLKNIQLFTSLKTMPGAIRFICGTQSPPDGFIAPGHVAAITGSGAFSFVSGEYKKPCVVAGFSPGEMLAAVREAIRQIENGESALRNFYPQAVTEGGQTTALRLMDKYFEPCAANWRGIGDIAGSGLRLREEFAEYDASSEAVIGGVFIGGVSANKSSDDEAAVGGEAVGMLSQSLLNACRCGEVMLGTVLPTECGLFGKICAPSNPVGACMVTGEGACGIYYSNV